jgi:hypothetical protein
MVSAMLRNVVYFPPATVTNPEGEVNILLSQIMIVTFQKIGNLLGFDSEAIRPLPVKSVRGPDQSFAKPGDYKKHASIGRVQEQKSSWQISAGSDDVHAFSRLKLWPGVVSRQLTNSIDPRACGV